MNLLLPMLDRLGNVVAKTAEQMALAIQREFSFYRHFANDQEERIWRSGLRATLELFVKIAKANCDLSDDERRMIGAIGETRAEQGVPLDAVLGSVRIAMHVALCAVRREATDDLRDSFGFEDAFDELSLRMTRFVNAVSTELSNGYIARSEAWATSLERDRAQFGSDLLAGTLRTYADVVAHADMLRLAIPRTLGLVLVPASGPTHALLAADLGRAVPSALVVPIGSEVPHTVLIVPAGTACDWNEATTRIADVVVRHRVTAVVAGPCDEPQEWHTRYVEAAAVIGLVAAFAEGRSIVDAQELLPAQLVATGAPVLLHALDREVLLPLRQHRKGQKLLVALDALMRMHGSPKAAARLLGVMPETARTYRATIEETTGLRFDSPSNAMRLGLAWLVLRYLAGTPVSVPAKTGTDPVFAA